MKWLPKPFGLQWLGKRCVVPLWGLFALWVAVGCSDPNGESVARYKDQVLFRGELRHHLPVGISGADSARLAQAYIQRWLREQYLAEVASDSLPGLEDRIAHQLADYRRKLIQLELEQYLLERHLDTVVTVAQAEAYYTQHSQDFLAREYQYLVRYAALPLAEDPSTLRAVFAWPDSASAPAKTELPAAVYLLWDVWVPPDSLTAWQQTAPPTVQLGRATVGGPVVRWQTPGETPEARYFRLLQQVRPGDVLPLSAVATDIYNRIVDERRYELLQRYQTKFAQELENQRDVQIY